MKFGNGTTYNPLCTTVFVPYVLQDVEASHQGPPSTIAEAMPKSMPIIGKYNLDEAQVGPMTLPGTKLGEKC